MALRLPKDAAVRLAGAEAARPARVGGGRRRTVGRGRADHGPRRPPARSGRGGMRSIKAGACVTTSTNGTCNRTTRLPSFRYPCRLGRPVISLSMTSGSVWRSSHSSAGRSRLSEIPAQVRQTGDLAGHHQRLDLALQAIALLVPASVRAALAQPLDLDVRRWSRRSTSPRRPRSCGRRSSWRAARGSSSHRRRSASRADCVPGSRGRRDCQTSGSR